MIRKRRGTAGEDDLFDSEPKQKKQKQKPEKAAREKKPRKSDRRATEYLDDMAEVPSGSFDDFRNSGLKSFRNLRRVIWATIIMAPLDKILIIVLTAAVVNAYFSPPEEAVQQEVQATEVGRTQAEAELHSWLSAKESAFAGATISSWDGVSGRREIPSTDDEPGFTELTHEFTIRTKDGQYLRADIRIAYAADRGAKVVSTPTITPMRASATGSWEPEANYPGWKVTSASDNVNSAVSSWATALTTNPGDLKLQIRDGDAGRVYTTISGVKVSSVSVSEAITPVDDAGAESDPDVIVATVVVNVQPEDAEDGDSNTTAIEYDVLIQGASTGAPYVTAWGPIGSGTSLKEYQNGVALNADDEQDQNTPVVNPSDGGGDTENTEEGDEG